MQKIEGQITDEAFVLGMLDTARETMRNYHAKQKLGQRSPIVVSPADTALAGTLMRDKLVGLVKGDRL